MNLDSTTYQIQHYYFVRYKCRRAISVGSFNFHISKCMKRRSGNVASEESTLWSRQERLRRSSQELRRFGFFVLFSLTFSLPLRTMLQFLYTELEN